MHYKNGREAKQGDVVVLLTGYTRQVGVLHTLGQGETCNARLTPLGNSDPLVTVGECLHVDDINAATVPDSSKA